MSGEYFGCSDGNCLFGHPGGMHTNGGCRCLRDLDTDHERRQRVRSGIKALRAKADFYRQRVDLLQEQQKVMRDPERTIVCDVIANCALLPDPKRYAIPVAEAEVAAKEAAR